MKKILFFIAIALFSSFFVPQVFAQAKNANTEKVLKSNEIVEKDYFAAGDNVALHGTVNGDAYLAGGNILVDGTVNGDIIAAGGQIIIEAKQVKNVRLIGGSLIINSKNITGNITMAGGQIDIANSSEIAGSLVTAGGNIRIGAPIGRGAHIAGGQISISNSINGDMFAAGNTIKLSPEAKINGNVTYWSENKISATRDQIKGSLVQKTPPDTKRAKNSAVAAFASMKIIQTLMGFVTAFIFGLIFIFLLPNCTLKLMTTIRSGVWKNLGLGFLSIILTPIVFVILLITILGIPFAFLLLFALILLVYFAKIFVSLVIGEKVFQYFKIKGGKVWMLIVGLLIYYIISFIPFLGGIISFLVMILGIGAMLILKKDYFILLRSKKII
jgi:hypothetical protein